MFNQELTYTPHGEKIGALTGENLTLLYADNKDAD